MSKLIVVFGGTGTQGGSVVNTFLDLPEWKVRTISRDPSKPACKELEKRGVEVVKGDLDDIESLIAAVQGAHLVFGVTDFWSIFPSPAAHKLVTPSKTINEVTYELEIIQGQNIAKALSTIVDTTLERYIWSSLSPAKKCSNGKYTWVYHFDSKAAVQDYIQSECPELAKKTSYLLMGNYAENYSKFSLFHKRPDGKGYVMAVSGIPGQVIPWVCATADTGKFVKGLWDAEPGKILLGVSEYLTNDEYTEAWAKLHGVDAHWHNLSQEELKQHLPPDMVREVWETLYFTGEFGWEGGLKGITYPKDLEIETTKVSDFFKAQDWSGIL